MKKFANLLAFTAAAFGARVHMEQDALLGTQTANWKATEVADVSDKMTVYFYMKHSKTTFRKLEQALMAVSDPRSPQYGQHLSIEELSQLAPISPKSLDTVKSFLTSEGVTDFTVNANNDMVEVNLSVAQAENLFQTDIQTFQHNTQQVSMFRATTPYSLPDHVAEVVSFVDDLVRLPALRTTHKVEAAEVGGSGNWPNACDGLSSCRGLVTPAVVRKAYSVDTTDDVVVAGNSMAVAEFQGQYWSQSDVNKFNDGCHLAVNVSRQVGPNQENGGVEAMLDIEYIGGVSPEIPMGVRYAAQYSLSQWAMDLSSDAKGALVHSVSYGNDEKQQTSSDYIFSTSVQFMKLGTRGISVLFASGDQGVCGREGCGFLRKRFKPDFPAACPYITAVGGTDFVTYDIGAEKAWQSGGGGFSDHFDIPSWQAEAVAAYKANPDADLPPQSMWNNTGRGYPDVAALGGQHTSYCVVANGNAEGVAGTSASCPVVSAIFAKLNGVRLAAGKAPLGFLNPFIYQNGDKFNDVTQGKNNENQQYGFTAVKGWDASTGWGSPNFAKLKGAVQALP